MADEPFRMPQWMRCKIAPKCPIQVAFKYLELGQKSSTGRVAQRITRLTTDQKIAGSNPAVLEILFEFFDFQHIFGKCKELAP